MTPSLDDCGKEIRVPNNNSFYQGDQKLKTVVMVIQGPKGIMRLFEPSPRTDYPYRDYGEAIRSFMEWQNDQT